jgi:Outer membrane protein (OmpH-like)
MRPPGFALVLLSIALPCFANDFRMARFDARRVFNEYNHTKEFQQAVDKKRSARATGREASEIEQRRKLKERLVELSAKVKQAGVGTPERERLEQAEKIALLELQIAEIRRELEERQRADAADEELRRNRAKVIDEIRLEASLLAAERGYALVVPDYAASELNVIITTAKSDDITEPLIERLNRKYQEALRK